MSKSSISLPRISAAGNAKRLNLSLEPDLAQELDLYAKAYETAYGEAVEVERLVPHMLREFLSKDSSFRKWKRDQAAARV